MWHLLITPLPAADALREGENKRKRKKIRNKVRKKKQVRKKRNKMSRGKQVFQLIFSIDKKTEKKNIKNK